MDRSAWVRLSLWAAIARLAAVLVLFVGAWRSDHHQTFGVAMMDVGAVVVGASCVIDLVRMRRFGFGKEPQDGALQEDDDGLG